MGQSQSAAAPSAVTRGLSDLASVEVQLVFHFLSASELLRLARCSQQLRQQADSPFAWKHAVVSVRCFMPPLPVNVSPTVEWPSRRLLRHAGSCRVVLRNPGRIYTDDHIAALAESMPQSPVSICEMDATLSEHLSLTLWKTLLQLPSVRSSLCVLRLNGFPLHRSEWSVKPGLMDLLVALPHLHTLSLLTMYWMQSDNYLPFRLPELPALTSLEIDDSWGRSLFGVARCSRLRSFHLHFPKLDEHWTALFAAPSMRMIEELTLQNLLAPFQPVQYGTELAPKVAMPSTDELAAPLRSMSRLRTVRLMRCASIRSGIELFLAALPAAPNLRNIVWHAEPGDETTSRLQLVVQLAQLMRSAMPLVHLTIVADHAMFEKLKQRRFIFKPSSVNQLGSRISFQLLAD